MYFFLFLACHQRGVIHRDIKDENLLVTISPHSKPKIELIDFGSGAHIGVNEIYFDFDGKLQSYFHIYFYILAENTTAFHCKLNKTKLVLKNPYSDETIFF